MRGLLPSIALGALMALLALAVVFWLGTDADASPAERAERLGAQLRCPDCQGLSIADSPTRSAQEIRRQVSELIADGASDEEIRAHFVARYGEWILLAPSSPAWWVLPFAVVLLAAAALVAWIVRRSGGATAASPPALSADERRRLHEEAEALDA